MTQAWVTLTSVDGRDIPAPTQQQLAAVLAELFGKRKKGDPIPEPASAALRFGYDDGLMYVAEVSNTGEIRFEEWSDSDCELALAAPRCMKAGQAQAQELWNMMAKRQVSRIREMAWQSGN
jgi:hypothetical protein